ncbi:hypothetical protein E1A91_D12G192600v1 [Gossypium mustelinum]|uniref:Uncharacterized protein n=1 Tax=Gossypium mustelinum TaxID=34275 RepID=A0A5D2SIH0_GOSMU|nr:hypothetical protein E1A91_D12G192600v1 [Gossypium mustelinum]
MVGLLFGLKVASQLSSPVIHLKLKFSTNNPETMKKLNTIEHPNTIIIAGKKKFKATFHFVNTIKEKYHRSSFFPSLN